MHSHIKTKTVPSLWFSFIFLWISACSSIKETPAAPTVEPVPVVPLPSTVQITPSAVPTISSGNATPSAPQPLVWYDFEGDFPTTGLVKDRSGNGNDAQVMGPVAAVRGISGLQAISFSGAGYIQAQVNPTAGRKELTLSLWFMTGQPKAAQKLASAAWEEGGGGSGWVLATDTPKFWGADGRTLFLPDFVNNPDTLPANAWVNRVVTYDGNHLREYTDGVLVNDWPTTGLALGDGNIMVVGGWPDGISYFDGAIDEFQVYAQALSPEQVSDLYSQTVMASHRLLPVPLAGSMFFPQECLTRQPGIDYWRYDWLEIKTMGGCGYIAPSPDGQSLAYSTLTCITAVDCGEAVRSPRRWFPTAALGLVHR